MVRCRFFSSPPLPFGFYWSEWKYSFNIFLPICYVAEINHTIQHSYHLLFLLSMVLSLLLLLLLLLMVFIPCRPNPLAYISLAKIHAIWVKLLNREPKIDIWISRFTSIVFIYAKNLIDMYVRERTSEWASDQEKKTRKTKKLQTVVILIVIGWLRWLTFPYFSFAFVSMLLE